MPFANTRSFDGINVFSAQNWFPPETELFNKETVIKILNSVVWESSLFKYKICIFFGIKSKRLLGGDLGRQYKVGTQDCDDFFKNNKAELNNISSISSYDFFIYIASDIGNSDNDICKTFTIAHEIQHIIQEILLPENLSKKHTLLWKLFKKSGFNTNKLPKEKDAIWKAKIINYDINEDKEIVDDFIFKKISESCEEGDKSYWEMVRDIDKADDDLRNEINKDCTKYNIC